MHTIELWLWRVTDPVSGRSYTTRHRMIEADALNLDQTAERVLGSLEVRQVPDSMEQHQHTSDWRSR